MSKQSPANKLTSDIINAFFSIGIFAFRQNVLPIPIVANGVLVGYRPPPIAGIPDVQAIIPRGRSSHWPNGSGLMYVEVKYGKDKIRPSQSAFHANARAGGDAVILVVHTLQEFFALALPYLDLLTPAQHALFTKNSSL